MRKAILLLVLLAVLFCVGCGDSLQYSAEQRARVRRMSWQADWMSMQDDLDHILLLEKNNRMNEYHVYIGK